MRVTARLAYGLTALIDLARTDGPVKGETLAAPHDIPVGFLENILGELRRAGLVRSRRGGQGGYWLARPPDTITVADVIHALHGPDPLDAAPTCTRFFDVFGSGTCWNQIGGRRPSGSNSRLR